MSEATELVLDMLVAGVQDLDQSVEAISEDAASWDVESLAILLVQLMRQIDYLKMIASTVEGLVAKGMDEELLVVPGATLERKWSKPRKRWNHAALKSVATEKILQRATDPETGAIQAPISQLITEALDVVGISYWKVTELRRLGITADNYCESEPGSEKLIIRRAGRPSLPGESEEGK